MTVLSFIYFLVPILTGILVIHLVWADRSAIAMLYKLCLGTGLGLGINSLLYFVWLLSSIENNILSFQIVLLIPLVIITVLREIRSNPSNLRFPTLSPLQLTLLFVAAMAVIVSGLTFINLTNARPQGARDAWSIWNRAARFIYRDPENWSATLSPDLYWATHPDYPLMVPLNVAWGWERIKTETQRVPMVQSALFTFASIGLMFASVALIRSFGQASLAALILMSTPILLDTGYAQISDIPLSFFILSTCTLIFLYFKFEKPAFLILAGLAAGLAAWTKNEGMLFVASSLIGLLLAGRGDLSRVVSMYLAGLAVPLFIVLYFKFILAPENDIFSLAEGGSMAKLTDLSRYSQITIALFREMFHYAGWPISIFVQLAIYALIMRLDISSPRATLIIAMIISIQVLGYCAIYVLTPHDLSWHLRFSFARLLFHVYPAGIYLYFCNVNEPEMIFNKRMKVM